MNTEQLLVIAKKIGLNARVEKGSVRYKEEWRQGKLVCGSDLPFLADADNILRIMCYFRIWIDDKADGSEFIAYHYDGQHKTEVKREGKATPEGIVEVVLELAYKLSMEGT